MTQPTACYDSLWEAVSSVDDARMWTRGLEGSGLNLVMGRPENAGTVFLVQDLGLVNNCNLTSVYDDSVWPKDACAQAARKAYLLLSQDEGRSLMMNHWLPGFGVDIPVGANDTATRNASDVGRATLLADAAQFAGVPPLDADVASIRFLDGENVALMDGAKLRVNATGYLDAAIVDERWLCDPSLGHVYVLDRPLGPPESMPALSATVLPGLQGYCDEALYPKLEAEGNFREDSAAAMAAFTFPLVPPMTNPMLNITIFAPNEYPTGSLTNNATVEDMRNQLGVYVLLSTLPGGWCPSDFGTDGYTFNSLAGVLTDQPMVVWVRQDPFEANKVHIELLYGDQEAKASAYLLTKACHATIYRSLEVLDPWKDSSKLLPDTSTIPRWDDLANATQESQFGASGECEMVVRNGPSIMAGDPLTSSSSSSLSTGAIVGIVIGSLAGVGLLLLLIQVWRRRRRGVHARGKTWFWQDDDSESKFAGVGSADGDESRLSNSILDYTLDDLLLKDSEVQLDRTAAGSLVLLGKGRFGKVYRGTLLGSEPVAVKCVAETAVREQQSPLDSMERVSSFNLDDDDAYESELVAAGEQISFCDMSREDILREVGLLKSCHSQYIVGFKGAMFRPHEVRLVTELMPSGDLWNALGHGKSERSVTWYNSGIYIAIDVAAGLRYLHEKMRVIHMDLKSSNILLRDMQRFKSSSESTASNTEDSSAGASKYTGSYQAKISDVGLSKILPMSHEYLQSMEAGGTWSWCAPEVILNMKCSSSADMYSYGVLLWEICTGETPIRGRMRAPRIPEECPQEVADLIAGCLWSEMNLNDTNLERPWHKLNVARRPTASECFDMLSAMLLSVD